MPGSERAKYPFRLTRLIQERARELVVLETLDNGKPLRETRDTDIPAATAHFFHHAGWADKLKYAGYGPTRSRSGWTAKSSVELPAADAGVEDLARAGMREHGRAQTSRNHFADRAGLRRDLPTGRVARRGGQHPARWRRNRCPLVAHEGANKVAFTGSTEVGKQIQRTLAGTSTRLTRELGGKAAHIVFGDAPINQVVEGIVARIFFNQGHVCCAGSRLFIQESAADKLLDKLRARVRTLHVGDPLDKNTDVGAINSLTRLERIIELAAAGEAAGATRWTSPCPLPEKGFFPPTVFTDVQPSMRIIREEVFDPVLAVLIFRARRRRSARRTTLPTGSQLGSGSRRVPAPYERRASCALEWCGRTSSAASNPPPRSADTRSPVSVTRAGVQGWILILTSERVTVTKTYKLLSKGLFRGRNSAGGIPRTTREAVFSRMPPRLRASDARDALDRTQGIWRLVRDKRVQPGTSPAPERRSAGGTHSSRTLVHCRPIRWSAGVVRGLDGQDRNGIWCHGPGSRPYFSFSAPESSGVVGVLAPPESALLGLISVVAPVIAARNTCVVVASAEHPLPVITFSEVLATFDVPGGAVNMLTGHTTELALHPRRARRCERPRPDRSTGIPSPRT